MSRENEANRSEFRAGTVALLGWTNVGKSTLLNRFAGDKVAAVSDVPQTTRHRIRGVCNLEGRGQIVFVDTPGLHRPRSKMNRVMVETVRQTLRDVDLAVLVVDAARGLGEGDRETAAWLAESDARYLAVLNKVDRVRPKSKLLPMMQLLVDAWGLPEVIPLSARSGKGCDALLERLLALLPVGPALYPEDYLTDQTERSIAAEWIREKLLGLTRQELPHATAVLIERWHERPDGLIEMDASILVDRDSQKQIVIGKGGELLKRVGTTARVELEQFLDRRVFLRLWVKTSKDWRNDGRVLQQLGLGD